jgi:hypothetical protein
MARHKGLLLVCRWRVNLAHCCFATERKSRRRLPTPRYTQASKRPKLSLLWPSGRYGLALASLFRWTTSISSAACPSGARFARRMQKRGPDRGTRGACSDLARRARRSCLLVPQRSTPSRPKAPFARRLSHKPRRPAFRCWQVTSARSRRRSNQSSEAAECPETALHDVGQDTAESGLCLADTAIALATASADTRDGGRSAELARSETQ